ncbi:MAG: hypothetical protein IKI29_04025 [Clostridia bacterium]|nr:hypothetical protein [Clostridia bacterium]
MAEYKKKTHRRFQRKPKKTVERDIKMTSSQGRHEKKEEPTRTVRVVKGKKLERRRHFRTALLVALVAAVLISFLSVVLPVGIRESFYNLTLPIGGGKYPIDLYGTQTLDTVEKNFYYYVLTDSDLMAVSDSGKKIFTIAHGYSHPVLKTSTTRALVFDQGGKGFAIWNLKECVLEKESKQVIRTATVSRSGSYAVVTDADSYTAVVQVFDKNNKLVFEWRSATDMINNVALSPSGKKLAVSTVNGKNGQLISRVLLFDFKQSSPVYSAEYTDKTVLSLENFGWRYLGVFTANSYERIQWNKLTKTERTDENPLAMMRHGTAGAVLVYRRVNDHSDNRIVVLSRNGQVKSEFKYNGVIGDIFQRYGHIYCIGENGIYVMNKSGTPLQSAACPFGGERIAGISRNAVAYITDNDITKVELNDVQSSK